MRTQSVLSQRSNDKDYIQDEQAKKRDARNKYSSLPNDRRQEDEVQEPMTFAKQKQNKRMQLLTPQYQNNSESNSNETGNRLPSIQDRITTGGFKKKFEKEAKIKNKRHNYMKQNLSEYDGLETDEYDDGTLHYHEFDILPSVKAIDAQ